MAFGRIKGKRCKELTKSRHPIITSGNNDVNFEFGRIYVFSHFQALGKLKATYGDSCLIITSLGLPCPLSLAPYLPNFVRKKSRHILGRMSVDWHQRQSHRGCKQAPILGITGCWRDAVTTLTFLLRLPGEQLWRRGVRMALGSAACNSSQQPAIPHGSLLPKGWQGCSLREEHI